MLLLTLALLLQTPTVEGKKAVEDKDKDKGKGKEKKQGKSKANPKPVPPKRAPKPAAVPAAPAVPVPAVPLDSPSADKTVNTTKNEKVTIRNPKKPYTGEGQVIVGTWHDKDERPNGWKTNAEVNAGENGGEGKGEGALDNGEDKQKSKRSSHHEKMKAKRMDQKAMEDANATMWQRGQKIMWKHGKRIARHPLVKPHVSRLWSLHDQISGGNESISTALKAAFGLLIVLVLMSLCACMRCTMVLTFLRMCCNSKDCCSLSGMRRLVVKVDEEAEMVFQKREKGESNSTVAALDRVKNRMFGPRIPEPALPRSQVSPAMYEPHRYERLHNDHYKFLRKYYSADVVGVQ